MLVETTIQELNGSVYVRIPPEYVRYFKLKNKEHERKCKIEDKGTNKAELTFKKW